MSRAKENSLHVAFEGRIAVPAHQDWVLSHERLMGNLELPHEKERYHHQKSVGMGTEAIDHSCNFF